MFESVVFLVREEYKLMGSSVLRSEQLCKLCTLLFAGSEIEFRVCYCVNAIINSIVIVSKMSTTNLSFEEFDTLKANGNILYGDYLDNPVTTPSANLFDGFIASSLSQQKFLELNFPNKSTVHITHHVDVNIPDTKTDHQQFQCGYFGERSNARYGWELNDKIDFIETPLFDRHWIYKLPVYSHHYAIRNYSATRGFKPFTKGFIAAHVGSVIIVDTDDYDACIYLGEDYPYRYKITNLQSALQALDEVKASFRTDRYLLASQRMKVLKEQVSPIRLKKELESLMSDASRRFAKGLTTSSQNPSSR